MPIYEYDCTTCATNVDKLAKIAERDEQLCDVCGNALIRVEVSLVAAPRADTVFQAHAITASGDKVAGNFSSEYRSNHPQLFKSGKAPTAAERKKHAHKAYVNRGSIHERRWKGPGSG